MSPEQIKGEVLDGRADLYALGVSAYWMLTGERPFDRQSDWHTMHAILNDEPAKPSSRNAAIPPGLDALLLKMLQKDRDKRPATGKEVADALEELASPSSVGGKKTTVAFLSEVLPSTFSRGNPVSEIKPTALPKPPDVSGAAFVQSAVQIPAGQAAAPIQAAPALASVEAIASAELPRSTVPFIPETAILPEPPKAPAPHVATMVQPLSPSSPLPPPQVKTGEEKPVVKPVTMPAGANAIGDLLAPPQRSGVPVPLVVFGLVVVIIAFVALAVVVPRLGGNAVDAGVVASNVDAGVRADAGTPTVLVKPPPPEMVTVTARAPSRIRWKAGETVVGLGDGLLNLPKTQKQLTAEDLRRGFSIDVEIVDGVADYNTVASGTVIIVRKGEGITITLGADDISTQRRLKLPVGRYRFKVVGKNGTVKETPIEVQLNGQHTLDAGK